MEAFLPWPIFQGHSCIEVATIDRDGDICFFCAIDLQIRVDIGKLFSLFLIQNICCGYSKELSQ